MALHRQSRTIPYLPWWNLIEAKTYQRINTYFEHIGSRVICNTIYFQLGDVHYHLFQGVKCEPYRLLTEMFRRKPYLAGKTEMHLVIFYRTNICDDLMFQVGLSQYIWINQKPNN